MGALGARSGGARATARALDARLGARGGLGRALLDDPAIRAQVRLRRAPSLLCGRIGSAGSRSARARPRSARPSWMIGWRAFWTPRANGYPGRARPPGGGAATPTRRGRRRPPTRGRAAAAADRRRAAAPRSDAAAGWAARARLDDRPAARAASRPLPEAEALSRSAARWTARGLARRRCRRSAARTPTRDAGPADDGERDVGSLVATLVHQPAPTLTLDRRVVQRAARWRRCSFACKRR